MRFSLLYTAFETCFPPNTKVLGSDSKTHLTSRFWRHFENRILLCCLLPSMLLNALVPAHPSMLPTALVPAHQQPKGAAPTVSSGVPGWRGHIRSSVPRRHATGAHGWVPGVTYTGGAARVLLRARRPHIVEQGSPFSKWRQNLDLRCVFLSDPSKDRCWRSQPKHISNPEQRNLNPKLFIHVLEGRSDGAVST